MNALKEVIRNQKCDLCLVQETKIMNMNRGLVKQLLFDDDFDWLYLPSVGTNCNSGGLLSIWNVNKIVKEDGRMGVNNLTVGLCSKVNGRKWGYMNAVRGEEKRNKGEGEARNNEFLNNFIMQHELVDLPSVGGTYTWSDMQEDPFLCRLDRFLLSVDFDLLFPDAIQVALTRVISDHKPIMLVTKPNIKSKPYFKFENGWLVHKDFLKKVAEWWGVMEFKGQASFVFFKKLQNLKYFLKEWSRKEFGGVKKEKEELTQKVDWLDQMEETHKLSDVQFGERMKIANARKKRNTIVKLEVEGVESLDQYSIKANLRSYFEGLFSEKNDFSFTLDNLNFPSITEVERVELEQKFNEEEVFDVVKHFGKNKSPGPDGFSMEFYKVCWPIIMSDFMNLMEDFYKYGSWDWRLNCSFITLIPKKEDSCYPKDYRPLSLLGSAYKVLSKVLANRLKKIMPKLVSEFQGAFIKGKQILDGVLIAGECVDRRLKAKKPGILCNIDMQKAFDNVRWCSLLRILEKHGFGSKWISWIRWCISSTNISVLVNGSSTEKFKPSKDDTLLFVDAKEEEVRRLLLILNSFELWTGMKINLEKSTIISVGADEVVDSLALELGYKVEKLPFKYLGLPIGSTTRCVSVWDEVIKRMEVKLASWKKNFLSKSGRLVLIRSVLASLPVYFPSLIPFPMCVEKRLNKIMRRFLWDSTDEKRKMSWVSWLKIFKPKFLGGLGVKDLRCTSKALKAKWIWRYANEKKALWRKVVQQKLNNGEEVCLPSNDESPQGRSNWKGILKSTEFMEEHVRKNSSLSDMIVDGRLHCQVRRRLYHYEQLELDLLCNELVPVHGLNGEADVVEIMGGFSVKMCYDLLVQEDVVCDFSKFLWKNGIPPKLSFLMWAIFHDSLPTYAMLIKVWSYFMKAFQISWVFPDTVKKNFEAWSMNNLKGRCKQVKPQGEPTKSSSISKKKSAGTRVEEDQGKKFPRREDEDVGGSDTVGGEGLVPRRNPPRGKVAAKGVVLKSSDAVIDIPDQEDEDDIFGDEQLFDEDAGGQKEREVPVETAIVTPIVQPGAQGPTQTSLQKLPQKKCMIAAVPLYHDIAPVFDNLLSKAEDELSKSVESSESVFSTLSAEQGRAKDLERDVHNLGQEVEQWKKDAGDMKVNLQAAESRSELLSQQIVDERNAHQSELAEAIKAGVNEYITQKRREVAQRKGEVGVVPSRS
ncbi:uncharacterized protein LOC113332471 [Papaver somniferum]|uniref:uncharacterized protein LOC113332471 n=1 Tax=Papaver somniferum TaxID=3469 RepID=UPI000E6F93CF|nr:uncharacterized protein LOC113332471 [Papaver somniferum]